MAPFDYKYLTSYLMTIVMFAFFERLLVKIANSKSLTLKIYGKVTENNIRNGQVRWQISTCINLIIEHFSLALAVIEILIFEIFDLEKVGQVHGVQHWQCHSQTANVKIYKRNFLNLEFFQDLTCANDSYTHTHTHSHTRTHSNMTCYIFA